MAIEEFTLGTLSKIDNGRIREAFEQALRRCKLDCQDRPAVEEPRTVSLKCTIRPVLDPDGEMDSCDIKFVITDTVPKRTSKTYNMKASHGGLFFNEMSPEDVRQETLDSLHTVPTQKNA